ncbi:uncharacterized protein BYT42DRAFT_16340 [Radiomyces spectabilis]|uniref:uncharacterized protein n=1 Tax=Radiomyces spectabilis TaxID=64574 RepID=UPI0022205910|nr:uncharacterized protein BYT42DRAFT_16340 [Radiomyces spectabilis]KAI8393716.1 hypothetical protein BYT42DRAFT_16340 [Radiomyces spectabilis]
MSTIRRNLKDMTTTDKEELMEDSQGSAVSSEQQDSRRTIEETSDDEERLSTGATENTEDNEPFPREKAAAQPEEATEKEPMDEGSTHTTSNEQDNAHTSKPTLTSFAQFGGGKEGGADEDWGEFAEDEPESKKEDAKTDTKENSKYTFGTTSGFGTKGWAATQQKTTTSQKPTFGGFGSSSFGGFSSSVTAKPSSSSTTPSFASFANASASPFALAAQSASTNAFSSLSKSSSAGSLSKEDDESDKKETAHQSTDKDSAKPPQSPSHAPEPLSANGPSFGEGIKAKVPGVKPTEVITGEEDEYTLYQTKAKLLVLDTTTDTWKERGVGTLRINQKEFDDKPPQTRLVMRADSVFRLILNLLLFPKMKVFIMQEKFVRFVAIEKMDDKATLVNYALRVANPAAAQELCDQITSFIPTE